MTKLSILSFFLLITNILSAQTLKFGIISDLHKDNIFDCDKRLEIFLDDAKKSNVDFVIDLGDFAMAKEENREFVDKWFSADIEKYNTIGNHDFDNGTKEEYMNFINMKRRYYSFEKGDYLFIVLDTNREKGSKNDIDQKQLLWLQNEIEKSDKRVILFSHHSLERIVNNREQVRALLEAENRRCGEKKVIASFSGHDHTNYAIEINGISYIQINSASYQWIGEEYPNKERFSSDIYKKHPILKIVAPYTAPLYGIVKLKRNKIIIDGTSADYIAPSPRDYVGGERHPNGLEYTSEIEDMVIRY